MTATQTIDQAKLDEFMGQFVSDLGAAVSAALVVIGDRLGLYRAMADGEPVTPEQLAQKTAGTSIITICSRAPSASSAPVTPRTSSDRGSRRWMACRRSSTAERWWPTSAAGMALRRS